MRALIQRVKWAKVEVEGQVRGEIGPGILTLLGVGQGDSEAQAQALVRKIAQLRIFEDEAGKMNRSLLDVGGAHLMVSQFTLYADLEKGNRPSFIGAAPPEEAKRLFERAVQFSREAGLKTETGVFQADMQVSLLNDGPVTLWIEK